MSINKEELVTTDTLGKPTYSLSSFYPGPQLDCRDEMMENEEAAANKLLPRHSWHDHSVPVNSVSRQ